MPPASPLPTRADIGREDTWTIIDQNGNTTTVTGSLLGMGSTWRPQHQNHPDTEYARRGVHCSTCRWTEIYLFAADDNPEGKYLTVTRGASIVPGDRDLINFKYAYSSFEVLTILRTRRGVQGPLTPAAAQAASQAAENDGGMRDAWINQPR